MDHAHRVTLENLEPPPNAHLWSKIRGSPSSPTMTGKLGTGDMGRTRFGGWWEEPDVVGGEAAGLVWPPRRARGWLSPDGPEGSRGGFWGSPSGSESPSCQERTNKAEAKVTEHLVGI